MGEATNVRGIAALFLIVLPLAALSGVPASGVDDTSVREPANTKIDAPPSNTSPVDAARLLDGTSLYYEPNLGQFHDDVLFRAHATGYTIFLTATEVVFVLSPEQEDQPSQPEGPLRTMADEEDLLPPASQTSRVVRLSFVDAPGATAIRGESPQAGVSHYIKGNDPSQWIGHVPHYDAVRYTDLWPGIDVLFYGIQGNYVEYDFLVDPGVDVGRIALELSGADSVSLAVDDLVIEAGSQALTWPAPVSYETTIDGPLPVESTYRLDGSVVSFDVSQRDMDHPLVIDPVVLGRSTFHGGSSAERAHDVVSTADGSVYVSGETESTDFPLENPYRTDRGTTDGFVTKFAPDGSLAFSTYYGGDEADVTKGIAVDQHGDVYFAGRTKSTNLPTSNAIQDHFAGGSSDAFIAKLESLGYPLLYATYLGGAENRGDEAVGIDVDSTGAAHVVGQTGATDFPLKNPFQSSNRGSRDIFVAKIVPNGGQLSYSTYFGGGGWDAATEIIATDDGYSYIVGRSGSSNFPTTSGVFQSTNAGGNDGIVAKFSPTGSNLFSTYYGGSQNDYIHDVFVDGSGNIHTVGLTASVDLPLMNAIQPTYAGNADAFVLKFNPTVTGLIYGTYLGGNQDDVGEAVVADDAGNTYVAGQTWADNFPLKIPYQSTHAGGWDAFVTKLTPDGSAFMYSTYLGGSSNDEVGAMTLTPDGRTLVVGHTSSSNFPVQDGYDSIRNGMDAFVTELYPAPGVPVDVTITPGPNQLNLAWSAPGDDGGSPIVQYNVYRGTTADDMALYQEVTSGTSLIDDGLANGATFHYAVSAQNDAFEGQRSPTVSATTFDVPSEPLDFVATAGPGVGEISIAWSEPADDGQQPITEYNVYRGTSLEDIEFLQRIGSTTSFLDQGLADDTRFFYQVTAVNSMGEGAASSVASAVTFSVPSMPLDFTATRGSAVGEIELSWSAPNSDGGTPITNYKIYRGTASGALEFLTLIESGVAWKDTGLPLGGHYFYASSAVNLVGEGPISAESDATAPDVPAPPVSLATTRGPDVGQITVDWSLNADDGGLPVEQNVIYSATEVEGPYTKIATIDVSTTFVDEGLPNGAVRCYRVASLNAAGEGATSSGVCGRAPDVPTAPLSLEAKTPSGWSYGSSEGIRGARSIELDWDVPADDNGMPITGYIVQRTTVDGGETALVELSSDATQWVDDDRIPGVRYYYTLRAVNGVGEGPNGNWDSARASTYPYDTDGDLAADPLESRICSTPGLQLIWEFVPGLTGHPLLGHCEGGDLRTLSGLDADGDLMADSLEAFVCLFEDTSDNTDGICVDRDGDGLGDDWGPPPS